MAGGGEGGAENMKCVCFLPVEPSTQAQKLLISHGDRSAAVTVMSASWGNRSKVIPVVTVS